MHTQISLFRKKRQIQSIAESLICNHLAPLLFLPMNFKIFILWHNKKVFSNCREPLVEFLSHIILHEVLKHVHKEWKAINAPFQMGAGVFIFCVPLSPISQKRFGKNYFWETYPFFAERLLRGIEVNSSHFLLSFIQTKQGMCSALPIEKWDW